jgi:hypothetical protein
MAAAPCLAPRRTSWVTAAGALLSVTLLDSACGAGHFLLAAARRIATRLARARAGGVASPSDYRHALRDVARACIPGVDHNPMAVELGCRRASGFFTLRMGTSLSVAAGAHHRSIRVCGHNGHCRPADRTMANECLITIPQKPFANSSSFCSPW